MTTSKHSILTLGVIAGVIAGVAGAVHLTRQKQVAAENDPNGEKVIPEVRVAKARTDTVRSIRILPATVEPTRLARLASPAEGPVTRLLVRERSPAIGVARHAIILG